MRKIKTVRDRGEARRTASAGEEAAGLPARRVAFLAVAGLLASRRAGALDDTIDQAARAADLPARDASLARAIASATFRHLGGMRTALAGRLDQGWPDDRPRLAALLATAAAQILHLNVTDHAAVDLAVRIARQEEDLAHLSGLVNAVLRRTARERAEILAAGEAEPLRENAPDWLADRWRAAYGDEAAEAVARAHLRGAPLDVTPKSDAQAWAERLGGRLLPTGSIRVDAKVPVPELPGFDEGAWWVQDAAAALPARLLAPQAAERVADLCAAPGGKTAQLAASGASVVAVDRSGSRLERLRANLARLGLEAETQVADATAWQAADAFDAVLLDAPCTATGTIRRHPDVAWTKQPDDLARLGALQSALLDNVARLVRPGGRIVYCTCSLEPEEGERQADGFLARHAAFVASPIEPSEVGGVEALVAGGRLRTLPSHLADLGGLDGFFAARFVKRA